MPAMPADDADDGEQFNPWELLTGPLAQVCYETRLTVILLELDRPTTINTESGPVDLYLLTMKMEVLALEMYERKRQNRLQMTPDEVKQFFSEVDLKVRGKLEGADDESLVFTDNLCKKRADRFTPSARQLFEQPPSSSQEPAGIAVEEDASDKDEFSHWDLLTPVIARACYETRVEVIFLELDQLTLVNTDHGPRDLYLLAIMLQVGALEKLRRERENLLQITYDELEDFFFKIDSKVIKEIDPDGDRSMTMSHNTTCKKMVDPLMENARRVFEKK